MRCVVTLSNIINRRPTVYPTSSQYLYYDNILNVGGEYFAPGEYTISADLDPEEGKTITCYAVAYEDWRDYEHHTFFPTTGEANLPFTFTLSAVKRIEFFFGYAGFRSAEYGEGEAIESSAVTNIKVAETGKPETEIYETVALNPQEIADSDVMAQAINSKSSVSLRVLPSFDAWGFAVRGLTIVRIYDLDLPCDRCIFKGRVSAVTDIMNDNGVVAQELTCVSAADFLEDTSFSDNISSQNLSTWVSGLLSRHNSNVDTARQLTGTVSGSAVVNSGSDYICKSDYGVFTDVLTNEKYLRENDAKAVYEWCERYQNDTAYIDIAAKIGTNKDTAIVIGENLKNIKIDRMTDGGIYTTVRAVSGVNADGYRYSLTAANGEMYARYGPGRELIIVNDNIYFVGKGGREYLPSGGYNWHSTPATDAMIAALRAWADQEAAKLSDPPITITLAAADLAAMGYSGGYERFEIGNSYPVVCPFVGLYGQLLRITGIKRRLSDGRIEQITISKGDTAGNAKSGTLSTQLSRLAIANNTATTDDDSKLIGITDQKIDAQTDGVKTLRVTKDDYDSSSHDGDTLYIIDDDGEKSMALGDDPIMKEGGGGVIETATVLSSGQMTEWAPLHDLVPTWFRGNAAVYYGQPPAKIIIQGQRATFGGAAVTREDIMSEISFEFRDGTAQRVEVYIHRMSLSSMRLGVKYYDISGAAEIFLGSAVSTDYFTTSSSAQIGMILTVSELYANPDLELAPQYGIMLAVKIGDTVQTATLPTIAASDFTGRNVDFGSAAERGFASGIARKTEPSG